MSTPSGPGEHSLLLTHAARWADSKKRDLDVDLLEVILDLVTVYDERSAQAWPTGSARSLLLHRWPANGPAEVPDGEVLRDTLDTYWRFLRATGRLTSGSAQPAELLKELRRALPQMAEATADRSNWSQGRVFQDFGASIGIDLTDVADADELNERFGAIVTAWNELSDEERIRLMPDPSPRTAQGVRLTEAAGQVMGALPQDPEGAARLLEDTVGPAADDPRSVYPHYRRGIPSVAIRDAEGSGFARKVAALVEWVGDGKAVTATGVLRPALAREAFAALGLATWERRYEAAQPWRARQPEAPLPPEAKVLDAEIRAKAIVRAGDNVALDRLWFAAEAARFIEVWATVARPSRAPISDRLHRAMVLVAAILERFNYRHVDELAAILLTAMVSPDGEFDLATLRDARWERSAFADRYADDPERLQLFREVTDGPIADCVAMFDDTGLWARAGDVVTITDFGREFSVVVTQLAEDPVMEEPDDEPW